MSKMAVKKEFLLIKDESDSEKEVKASPSKGCLY
jgi:hypothetical protein